MHGPRSKHISDSSRIWSICRLAGAVSMAVSTCRRGKGVVEWSERESESWHNWVELAQIGVRKAVFSQCRVIRKGSSGAISDIRRSGHVFLSPLRPSIQRTTPTATRWNSKSNHNNMKGLLRAKDDGQHFRVSSAAKERSDAIGRSPARTVSQHWYSVSISHSSTSPLSPGHHQCLLPLR